MWAAIRRCGPGLMCLLKWPNQEYPSEVYSAAWVVVDSKYGKVDNQDVNLSTWHTIPSLYFICNVQMQAITRIILPSMTQLSHLKNHKCVIYFITGGNVHWGIIGVLVHYISLIYISIHIFIHTYIYTQTLTKYDGNTYYNVHFCIWSCSLN